MPKPLENYVTVAERLAAATEAIQSITTEAPVMLTEVMGYIRAVIVFNDGRVMTGTASFRLDLEGRSAQATNPLEDAETSAVGRALALAGYEVQRGVASREEVAEAQRRAGAQQPERARTPVTIPDCDKCGAAMRWSEKNQRHYCHECWQRSRGN